MARQRTLVVIASIAIMVVAGLSIVYSNNQPKYQEPQTQVQVSSSSTGVPSFSHTTAYNFDNDAVGSLPTYLQAGLTGQGTRSEWSVMQDSRAPTPPNILAQTANETVDAHYPYVILTGQQNLKDVNVSVSFKAVSGNIDRAGGIIFRFVDSRNYYVLRANALEGNVILFKYVGGVRSPIVSASTPVSSGEWHSLTIVATGNTLLGYMDHRLLISIQDSTYNTGAVGLWTKADSVTYFDNLVINY